MFVQKCLQTSSESRNRKTLKYKPPPQLTQKTHQYDYKVTSYMHMQLDTRHQMMAKCDNLKVLASSPLYCRMDKDTIFNGLLSALLDEKQASSFILLLIRIVSNRWRFYAVKVLTMTKVQFFQLPFSTLSLLLHYWKMQESLKII